MSLPPSEFARRRKALMRSLGDGAVAIVQGASLTPRNRDSEYPFRQDSDFHYLTGFDEPEALLVLRPGRGGVQAVMFCQPRDPLMEIWHGFRAGPEGAVEDYGLDAAFSIDEIDDEVPRLLADREAVYFSVARDTGLDARVIDWLQATRLNARMRRQGAAPVSLVDIDPLLHEQRLIKSPAEQRVMRKAGAITAAAHVRAMRHCRPGCFEYQLEAELQHEFAQAGARFPAYSSIVGAGANACVLHYVANNCEVSEGDLVLIDAGCELDCYAADVTRTFPASGRFSAPQKALYELVLKAQAAAIRQIAPGRRWNRAHDAAVRVLTQGLVELGLLKGDVKTLIKKQAYRDFYMHNTGHWLGLDVHDVGEYRVDGRWRVLEPGMVLTVEPGLYVAPGNTRVARKWRGIGIRIEDDVLVTASGCEVLTDGVPKTVAGIEALMAQGSHGD